MAGSKGFSRIVENRRWEDYKSLKQYCSNKPIKEYIISGYGQTNNAEFEFTTEAMDYIGTEAQTYIRTVADDGSQDNKYVWMEYQDDTGLILDPVTADITDTADNTIEVAIGSTDFWRLRQMYAEVEGVAGSEIVLTDDDMDAASRWAMIEDGETQWHAQRYFVPIATQCKAYLGRVIVKGERVLEAAAASRGIIMSVTLTPRVVNIGEVKVLLVKVATAVFLVASDVLSTFPNPT